MLSYNENAELYLGQLDSAGRRSGIGRLLWTDGSYYEGEFEAGHMSGKGRLLQDLVGIYDGEWRKSRANGKGRLVRPSKGYWRYI